MSFDSIVTGDEDGFMLAPGLSPQSLAVKDWKLISEGGSFVDSTDRCERDTVPAAPYQALCESINADADHSCVFESRPDATHCADWAADINVLCVDDFMER